MDKIDRRILEFLLQDARTPFSMIANSLGVSVDTISKRYARLKESRMIRSATLILDVGKIGGGLTACLNITAITGRSSDMESKLREFDEIFLLGKTFGAYDFFALVTAENLEILDKLRSKISAIHLVKTCDVSLITSGLNFVPMNQLPRASETI